MKPHFHRNKKGEVTLVQFVDPTAGPDGAYVDRCISSLQNSHSQVSVLLEDAFTISSGTSVTNAILAGPQIALFDDFVSLSSQFETFRIRAIRFDIYDINPGVSINAFWSTFHDQFTAGAQPVFTQANVVDGPDSAIVPPGTGKITLYWRAKGTLENQFVTNDSSSVAVPTQYFGGLRYGIASSASATAKWQVIVKAVVDFRGRY
jgi:hypothetical protein